VGGRARDRLSGVAHDSGGGGGGDGTGWSRSGAALDGHGRGRGVGRGGVVRGDVDSVGSVGAAASGGDARWCRCRCGWGQEGGGGQRGEAGRAGAARAGDPRRRVLS
jgi:hypothetical protein